MIPLIYLRNTILNRIWSPLTTNKNFRSSEKGAKLEARREKWSNNQNRIEPLLQALRISVGASVHCLRTRKSSILFTLISIRKCISITMEKLKKQNLSNLSDRSQYYQRKEGINQQFKKTSIVLTWIQMDPILLISDSSHKLSQTLKNSQVNFALK